MGLFDKIRDIMGVEEDDYENEEMEFVGANSMTASSSDVSASKSNKVVSVNATTSLQVVLVSPERFDDASSVADLLIERRAVVLNLEGTPKEASRRLLDFLTGVSYANDGHIKRVANNTFIITPRNVDIVGDILDELQNNGSLW